MNEVVLTMKSIFKIKGLQWCDQRKKTHRPVFEVIVHPLVPPLPSCPGFLRQTVSGAILRWQSGPELLWQSRSRGSACSSPTLTTADERTAESWPPEGKTNSSVSDQDLSRGANTPAATGGATFSPQPLCSVILCLCHFLQREQKKNEDVRAVWRFLWAWSTFKFHLWILASRTDPPDVAPELSTCCRCRSRGRSLRPWTLWRGETRGQTRVTAQLWFNSWIN